MPTNGERSRHDCPDCGRPMYWSEAAVRNRYPTEYAEAYRCTNGHTSQPCPLCGSNDTASWADTVPGPLYHVICGQCGNDSVVNK